VAPLIQGSDARGRLTRITRRVAGVDVVVHPLTT